MEWRAGARRSYKQLYGADIQTVDDVSVGRAQAKSDAFEVSAEDIVREGVQRKLPRVQICFNSFSIAFVEFTDIPDVFFEGHGLCVCAIVLRIWREPNSDVNVAMLFAQA